MSLRRTMSVIVAILLALVGGTWAIVQVATGHLLYEDASSSARGWAHFLAVSLRDLEQIAGGEQPSAASMTFFAASQRSPQVFRYEIFNREGYSQLVADRRGIAQVNVSDFRAEAASAIRSRQPVVAIKEGGAGGVPSFYSVAYVPVLSGERPIAIVAAYVDQTAEHALFYHTSILAAVSLCLLIAFAFGIPAVAWYRRTEEKRRADARIHFLAHNDSMTRLANRATFIERTRRSIAKLPKSGPELVVHYINIDRFGTFNLARGRDAGDFVLTVIAHRLRMLCGPGNFTARLGGDEFAVLQTAAADTDAIMEFARQIAERLMEPLERDGLALAVTASIGIARCTEPSADPENVMRQARLALNECKTDGGNRFYLFSGEMDVENQARMELEAAIREATAKQSFELAYQGLFSVEKGCLIGFEALLRLPGADGKSVSPAVFVPVAELLGLIETIGTWVLDEACRFASTWPSSLSVSVNLSPAQFAGGRVCQIVADTLARYSLDPSRLELEITESLMLRDTELVMIELRKLKAMGVRIAMDDFGTGYSSLAYLWRFPFDKLKIDRAFIWAYDGGDAEAGAVMKTIVALARSLDMRITVEGVENEKQADFVRELGCDEVQGFLFARPIAATALSAAMLKKAKADTGRTKGPRLAAQNGRAVRMAV